MSPFALALALPALPGSGSLDRLRRHLARLEAAHDGLARLEAHGPDLARDTRLVPRETLATEIEALPFFFRPRV